MPGRPVPYQLYLFTLRLWPEVLDGDRWEWRGEVKNTGTGELRYFRDWPTLLRLLPDMLADAGAPRSSSPDPPATPPAAGAPGPDDRCHG